MNEKAYKFSVRDDTSFRVESGGGDSENPLSVCKVTLENTGGRDVSTTGLVGVEENNGIKFPTPINRILSGVTAVEDVILIDGTAYASFGNTTTISVSGNAEISYPEPPIILVTITGDATITVSGVIPE